MSASFALRNTGSCSAATWVSFNGPGDTAPPNLRPRASPPLGDLASTVIHAGEASEFEPLLGRNGRTLDFAGGTPT
jgi:hypothetical protein